MMAKRALGLAVAGLGVGLMLMGCGSEDGTEAASTPTDSPPATSSPTTLPATPLDGAWQTEPIVRADYEATLRQQGLEEWIEPFREVAPFSDPSTVLVLEVSAGAWNLYGGPPGESPGEIDFDAEYVIDGDEVTVIHAVGSRTLGWSIDGNALTLESQADDLDPTDGIPDEVFQVALYTTSSFTRQG